MADFYNNYIEKPCIYLKLVDGFVLKVQNLLDRSTDNKHHLRVLPMGKPDIMMEKKREKRVVSRFFTASNYFMLNICV